MALDNTNTETTGSTVANKTATLVHPKVGAADGAVDPNGEKIVYDYDEAGTFVGWHKEAK